MFEVLKKNWKLFLFPICIITIYGVLIIFKNYPISEFSIEKAGQFGDSFGIINTLFSGLAFIALVITIYLQQQEIKESIKQKDEEIIRNKEKHLFYFKYNIEFIEKEIEDYKKIFFKSSSRISDIEIDFIHQTPIKLKEHLSKLNSTDIIFVLPPNCVNLFLSLNNEIADLERFVRDINPKIYSEHYEVKKREVIKKIEKILKINKEILEELIK